MSRKTWVALEVLTREGCLWVQEASSSMAPLIRPGDWLRLDPLPRGRLSIGTLVAYRSGERLVMHRVLRWSDAGLVAKGDALPSPDPLVPWDHVVGRVNALRRLDGRVVDFGRFPWPALNALLGVIASLAWRLCRDAPEDPTSRPTRRPLWRALRLPFHATGLLAR
jgi:hypothetical protein